VQYAETIPTIPAVSLGASESDAPKGEEDVTSIACNATYSTAGINGADTVLDGGDQTSVSVPQALPSIPSSSLVAEETKVEERELSPIYQELVQCAVCSVHVYVAYCVLYATSMLCSFMCLFVYVLCPMSYVSLLLLASERMSTNTILILK
jgi:hypothetical protein